MIVLIATNRGGLLEKTQDPKWWYLPTVSCRQRIQTAKPLKYSLSSKAARAPERPGVSSNCLLSIRPCQDMLSVLDQEPLTDVWTSQNLGAQNEVFYQNFLYFTGHVGIFCYITSINYGTLHLSVARCKWSVSLLSMNNANKLMPTTQTHEGFIQNKTVNQ